MKEHAVAGRSRRRALPAVVGAAVLATLIADAGVLVWGDLRPAEHTRPAPEHYVSVAQGSVRPVAPVVAPLRRRLTPHLLIAGGGSLSPAVVDRARHTKGVAAVEVVDAARAQVAGRRVGLLGVEPSTFRVFAPRSSAESDQLWQTVATGDLAVSFDLGQNGGLALGGTVPAGSSVSPGQVRVGAYATMGIGDVDAIVSHAQAKTLGMPSGNGLLVSARKTSPAKLTKALRRILPRGTKIAPLVAARERRPRGEQPRQAPRPAGRPDGVNGPSTPVTGNTMTPRMRTVLLTINNMFGPFPTIGCYRPGDPQDHGTGRACDFMESTGGRMPTAAAQAHGDQVAQYAISNAGRLGIKYVIWKQQIWNITGGGWRRMGDRGSITQNHYDHVHISVL